MKLLAEQVMTASACHSTIWKLVESGSSGIQQNVKSIEKLLLKGMFWLKIMRMRVSKRLRVSKWI